MVLAQGIERLTEMCPACEDPHAPQCYLRYKDIPYSIVFVYLHSPEQETTVLEWPFLWRTTP